MTKATVRDLRNSFPKIRQLVESEGEVVVTERGTPKYRLTLFTPKAVEKNPPKDYVARLKRHQPRPMPRAAAKRFNEENRGGR